MQKKLDLYKGILNKAVVDNEGKIKIQAYIPDENLKTAVNIMLMLKERPLLLMGEPGCGKTRLAEAVAYELHDGDKNYKDYYFEWNIKSTSKVKDGLYRYDTLLRFSDAQINPHLAKEDRKDLQKMELGVKGSYIQPGILAKAFDKAKDGKPVVVLIDEIDKADIDFPNDLLHELDKKEFTIEEIPKTITRPENPPLIFITSNGEKELPPAFLRRCLFHYIKFPNTELLKEILIGHFGEDNPEYIKKAVEEFEAIRERLSGYLPDAEKKVSTSELIDWFKMINQLLSYNEGENLNTTITEFRKKLESWKRGAIGEKIPFSQILLKNVESLQVFQNELREQDESGS